MNTQRVLNQITVGDYVDMIVDGSQQVVGTVTARQGSAIVVRLNTGGHFTVAFSRVSDPIVRKTSN